MSKVSVDDEKLKELIKGALREVLEERDVVLDEALDEALQGIGLADALEEGMPAGPVEELAELEDLEEDLGELLDNLAQSARAYLDVLGRFRRLTLDTEHDPELTDELHDTVMQLEQDVQDAHDLLDEMLNIEFEELDDEDDNPKLN